MKLRMYPLPGDEPKLRELYNSSFPLQYGDNFYQALMTGSFSGKALISIVAEEETGDAESVLMGAVSASYDSTSRELVAEGREAIYVLTLAVKPEFRRRHIASELMDQVRGG